MVTWDRERQARGCGVRPVVLAPPEHLTATARASARNIPAPLRWLFCYLYEPYEWGGHWFGGRDSEGEYRGGGSGYQGYGIDCSGLVSCGARWARYNWPGWRYYTIGIPSVSEEIPNADVEPGDILNRPTDHCRTCINLHRGGHVRSIYHVYPYPNSDRVDLIASEGDQGVTDRLINWSINNHEGEHYELRRLKAYCSCSDHCGRVRPNCGCSPCPR